jgi:hypothetical protein
MFTIIAMALMAAAAVVGAVSSIQQGKRQSESIEQQAAYNRSVAESQAKQAANNAKWAEYKISVMEENQKQKKIQAQKTATEKIAAAKMKKGIASGSGSLLTEEIMGLNELTDTLHLIDWETEVERKNIKREQEGYGYQSKLYEAEADWSTLKGETESSNATSSSYWGAGSSLLAGGAKMAGAYKGGTPKTTTPSGVGSGYEYNWFN